ncbi:MAG TPA: TraB/GumN family protein [Rhizomicrobium sp.]|nr:TraB/GumN family protein [Rhizomicrobium sp.]
MKRAALALTLLLPAAAVAQTAPPPSAPIQDWSNVETVTVVAPKGPAMWHITQGASEIWILPTIAPVPSDFTWNSDGVEDVIRGANAVYLPAELTANFWQASWFLITGLHKIEQPDGQSLRATLPPDLRKRFEDWLVKAGDDADDYDDYLAAIAGLRLESDYLKNTKMDGRAAIWRVSGLAEIAGLKAKPVASYDAMPIADEVGGLSADQELNCMRASLDDLDTIAAHALAAAHAWSIGDIAGLKANYSEAKAYDCFNQTRTFADDRAKTITATVNAIDESLTKPGRTVFVMELGIFLRKNGVLDRLAAQGIKVEGPPD